jgi:hypothetical protein
MNLLGIRTKFVELSGRVDLVVDQTGYADNGADFFIQSGQKTLDALLPTQKSSALAIATVSSGDFIIATDARSIHGMFLIRDDESVEGELKQLLPNVYRERFGYKNGLVTEGGRPQYFTIENIRDESNVPDSTFSQVLVIGPTPDASYDIIIDGLYYPQKLVNDTDENFWSINHPDTLVQAGLYALERFYRNTQGMNDHMAAIMRDVQGIDYDIAEQEAAITDQMTDSFNSRLLRPRRYYGDFSGHRYYE